MAVRYVIVGGGIAGVSCAEQVNTIPFVLFVLFRFNRVMCGGVRICAVYDDVILYLVVSPRQPV